MIKIVESLSNQEKQRIYNAWVSNVNKIMKKSNYPKPEYSYLAYNDETYYTWKSLLDKSGIKY